MSDETERKNDYWQKLTEWCFMSAMDVADISARLDQFKEEHGSVDEECRVRASEPYFAKASELASLLEEELLELQRSRRKPSVHRPDYSVPLTAQERGEGV